MTETVAAVEESAVASAAGAPGGPDPCHQREPRPDGWRTRFLAAFRLASPALGAYLALRAISLDVLVALTALGHQLDPDRKVYWDGSTDTWRGYNSVVDILLSWDGRWYSKIAEFGYTDQVTGVDEYGIPYTHRLAFFPLYPYLARSLTWIPGVSAAGACLIVSFLSSIAAAWAIFAIGNHLRGRRFGIVLAALWAVVPVCMSQNGAFTESLFTALAGWALYAVLTRRWVLAGVVTAVTGLTRPTALAIVGTVGLAALVAILTRRDGWRPYAAAALAPLGYLGYVLFAGYRLGSPTGFFHLQRYSWDSYFDYGRSSSEVLRLIILGRDPYNAPIFLFTGIVIIGVAALIVLAAMNRTPWVLVVFAAVIFIGSLGSHAHISSMGRHLLPAFPALIVPALALSRARTRSVVLVLILLAGLSGWYGGWLPFASGHV
ncbi:MAG: glycosyltransferase family 39 protein, partial [Micromonosporaceae bacterium]|nr:glycosyltransferase family 39 protein [Micromonosporaceae bacterium]